MNFRKYLPQGADPAALPQKVLAFSQVPDWHFSAMLALQGLFMFVVLPALNAGKGADSIALGVQTLLVAAAILLILQTLAARITLAASFALTLSGRLLPGPFPHVTTLSAFLAYNMLLTIVVARAVFGPGRISSHRISGAVFIYLNIALLFAVMFAELMQLTPGAVTGAVSGAYAYQMLHFSFGMLTGNNDGKMVAKSAYAASLADFETVIGQLFPAILLARLVGLHIAGKAAEIEDGQG